jgi:hypothetical protein
VAKVIGVPRTPTSAYNPKRRVSDLLKAHITNLEAVTGHGAAAGPKRKPKNEAQASAYISEMTRQLHPTLYASTALAPAPAGVPSAPAVSPAAPAARRRRTARKKKRPAGRKSARAVRRRTGKKTGKTRKPRKAKQTRKTTRKPSRY